jgi:ComF family protein
MTFPMTMAARCLAGIGRRLWPAVCLVCREPAGPGGRDLCRPCADALPWNRSACGACALPLPVPAAACGACLRRPPPLTETRAVFRYAAPLDRLLPRLKFHGDLAAGRLCAGLMAHALADSLAQELQPQALAPRAPVQRMLVPLPLHRDRLRTRGFDQALELARPLGRALALPVADDLLRRVRDTAPQSRLDAAARRRNLRGAFALAPGATPPAHVVLVDDVMTTGATLHAAANALLRAGALRVDAWVCARVE